jgi:hypothetical protein
MCVFHDATVILELVIIQSLINYVSTWSHGMILYSFFDRYEIMS